MKHALLLTILMTLSVVPTGCVTGTRGFREPIENFDMVDDKLYRGAQPNAVGIAALKTLGVTTVINFRSVKDSWSEEEGYAREAGMDYINYPLNAVAAPSYDEIERILEAIKHSSGPVFIHCQFGCDRTGTVVACYRIRVRKENPTVALQDAEQHGMSAWEVGMKNFIRNFK